MIRRVGLEHTAVVAMLVTATGVALRGLAGNTGSLLLLSIVALAGMGIAGVVIPRWCGSTSPTALL
ncbi:hypothetical protein [Streptomyces malaysiensis]|nr:hypothetical protein [Streptomyces malaysiensis]